MLRMLRSAESFSAMRDCFQAADFGKLKAVRGGDVSQEKKKYVGDLRDRAKKAVQKIRDSYFAVPEEKLAEAMRGTVPVILEILKLAEEFSQRYQEAKREKNVVDFNDLEHFALQVLSKDGEPSETAKSLSERFEEILVDEYQDSNEVQETLIRLISRERLGRPNVFMVGGCQAEYLPIPPGQTGAVFGEVRYVFGEGWRLSEDRASSEFPQPSLCAGQCQSGVFPDHDQGPRGIRYTEETALHAGAAFQEIPEDMEGERPGRTELLLLDVREALIRGIDEEYVDYTAREMEARLVAERIREMTDREHGLIVWDKAQSQYRRARFGDMVVLLRSTAGWADVFVNVLMNEGIPAHAESRTGYFDTPEVETILALLSVLDNPMQDIPLAAVMRSPHRGYHRPGAVGDGGGLEEECQERGRTAACMGRGSSICPRRVEMRS